LRKSQLAASLVECSLLLALIIMIATPAISFLSFSTNRMFCGMVRYDDQSFARGFWKQGSDGNYHCWKSTVTIANPGLYYF
ncbi:MAG: hypothetical protein J5J00_08110, partial [Deltaproteobacteria bacterium]|nr:hypothetical protein [Deltaproteobacteria bacterium]